MKNIISNIIGIIIQGIAIYSLIELELALTSFAVLMSIGGVLFYFENRTIKKYLKKVVDKYLNK
tara:strand:+ start:308 stop:499 length:192 start_codon:yes stop_codon:yes gene_type:complete